MSRFYGSLCTSTQKHTQDGRPFNGLFYTTTWVSRHQIG